MIVLSVVVNMLVATKNNRIKMKMKNNCRLLCATNVDEFEANDPGSSLHAEKIRSTRDKELLENQMVNSLNLNISPVAE